MLLGKGICEHKWKVLERVQTLWVGETPPDPWNIFLPSSPWVLAALKIASLGIWGNIQSFPPPPPLCFLCFSTEGMVEVVSSSGRDGETEERNWNNARMHLAVVNFNGFLSAWPSILILCRIPFLILCLLSRSLNKSAKRDENISQGSKFLITLHRSLPGGCSQVGQGTGWEGAASNCSKAGSD